MKYLLLVLSLLSLFSVSSYADETFEYSCGCIDTGLECDGQENLNVAITGERRLRNEAECFVRAALARK